jgi:hypothetical protein
VGFKNLLICPLRSVFHTSCIMIFFFNFLSLKALI